MEDLERNLEKYADLIVKIGVNLQKGQQFIIEAHLESYELVRKIVSIAYDEGAKFVHVFWNDDELSKIRLLHANQDSLSYFPEWKAKLFEKLAEESTAYLSIGAPNPELFQGINQDKVSIFNKAIMTSMSRFLEIRMNMEISWCLAVTPTKAWASKVFPDLKLDERVEKLWKLIFKVNRLDSVDPVKEWKNHIQQLQLRLAYLNNKRFKKLHYKSPGTDLKVELPSNHIWQGGGITNSQGVYFVPNLPTEEVFTLPLKNGVNGTVKSTMPLIYRGSVINNFILTFEQGKVVDFKAETGQEALQKLIETDEGSCFLGEVALVSYDSPISKLGVTFYHTGLDENSSCHLAFGNAYPICLENGSSMSKEELINSGANLSLTHVDFMIGSSELNIDGETSDGKVEPIFKSGKWAI